MTKEKEDTPAPQPPRGKGEKENGILRTRQNSVGLAPPVGEGAEGTGSSLRLPLHLFVLFAFLGLWTWKLLEPNPVPEAVSAKLQGEVRFVAAKGLHAGGYGFLTLLAVALPVPNRWRWVFVALLALHGAATEIGQTFVPGRTGSVRDVLIDWGGVLAGVLVWRVLRGERGA